LSSSKGRERIQLSASIPFKNKVPDQERISQIALGETHDVPINKGPVTYTDDGAFELQRYIITNIHSDITMYTPPKSGSFIELNFYEVRRFLNALKAYRDSDKPAMSINFLVMA